MYLFNKRAFDFFEIVLKRLVFTYNYVNILLLISVMQYVFMKTTRQDPKLYDVYMTVKSTNPLSTWNS